MFLRRLLNFVFLICLSGALLGDSLAASSALENRLSAADQRIEELEKALQKAREKQEQLGLRLEKAIVTGKSTFRLSSFEIKGVGEKARAFDGYPFWFDPVQTRVQTHGNKANNWFQMDILGRAAAGYELRARLNISNIWPSTGGTVTAGPIFARAKTLNSTITVGNFSAQLTPFTLYYPTLERPFEGALWQSLRARRAEEIGLVGQSRQFQGVQIEYADKGITLTPLAAVIRAREDGYPFYRYLFALRSSFALTPAHFLALSKVRVVDDLRTGQISDKPAANTVVAIDYHGKLLGMTVEGELAGSEFASDYAGIIHLEGEAARINLERKWAGVTLGYGYSRVTPNYFCPPAQSRDLTLASGTRFGSEGALTLEGFPLAQAAYEVTPFGPATPNRRLSQWSMKINSNYGDFALTQISGTEVSPTGAEGEITSLHQSLRKYHVVRWGGGVSLQRLLPSLKPVLPWPVEMTVETEKLGITRADDPQTGEDEAIAFKRASLAGGMEVKLARNASILLGWRERRDSTGATEIAQAFAWRYRPHTRWELQVGMEKNTRRGTAEDYQAQALKADLQVEF